MPGVGELITLLFYILIFCIILYAVKLAVDMIQLPQPVKTIVWLIIGVIALVILFGLLRPFMGGI